MARAEVWGLLNIGPYKIYKRGAVHYAGCKDATTLRRVELPNRAEAERLAALRPLSLVGPAVERLLVAAKLKGLPTYYEVRHRA